MTKDIYGGSEFSRPLPEDPERPAGDYTLPGRADMADLALNPDKAHLVDIVRHTAIVTRTLAPTEAIDYRQTVRTTFPHARMH